MGELARRFCCGCHDDRAGTRIRRFRFSPSVTPRAPLDQAAPGRPWAEISHVNIIYVNAFLGQRWTADDAPALHLLSSWNVTFWRGLCWPGISEFRSQFLDLPTGLLDFDPC